ncbi:MAG: hypothetical protein H7X80_09520 [bacterium]|nr:hypothetical protein [Candidatus Kapabacteria bacterium]
MRILRLHYATSFTLAIAIAACAAETPVDPNAIPNAGSGWDRRFVAENSPNNIVSKITAGTDLVFVGGSFNQVRSRGDQKQRQHIVAWTGADWKTLVASVAQSDPLEGATAKAMEMFEGELHVAGTFDKFDGVNVFEFAKWNGTEWKNASAIRPYDIAVSGVNMYVASAHGACEIRNGAWIAFETGLATPKYIKRIAAIETTVYGQLGADVFEWTGVDWKTIGTVARTDAGAPIIHDIIVINHTLYAIGDFDKIGSTTLDSYGIARWDGTRWVGEGDDRGSRAAVYALTRGAQGGLLAGRFGALAELESTSPSDPMQWTIMGDVKRTGGEPGKVLAVAVHKGIVYIGGDFTSIADDGQSITSHYFGAYH